VRATGASFEGIESVDDPSEVAEYSRTVNAPRRLLAWFILVLAAGSLAACGGGTGTTRTDPTPTSTGTIPNILPSQQGTILNAPPCTSPPEVSMPSWIPKDLPFPAGTYVTQNLADTSGYHRIILVVPGSLVDLAKMVLNVWPTTGWVLGRGDSEPGEIEDQFSRPPALGAFKAQAIFCNPGYNLMLLIFTPDRTSVDLPGTGGGTPISPQPSASPSA
jgi:hypothetical protein